MDDPDHRAYRGLTQAGSCRQSEEARRRAAAELAKRYVDLMMEKGPECDSRARSRSTTA